ncbi:AMP-binding protein [Streptomyces sp. NPDC002586]
MKTASALIAGTPLTSLCLPDLLTRQAALRPEATAVTFREERLSYRELDRQSRDLGTRLARLGIGPDTCVGLFTEPSLDLMTGVWGILGAGAACLPLSPDYPEDRLRYMIEDSGASVVVTQEHLRERLAALAPRDVLVLTPAEVMPGPGDRTAVPDRQPGHLAYVIYTSGSTGRP